MKRVVTALTAASLAVAAIVLLESFWVFWIALALAVGCAVEYVALGKRLYTDLPRAPLPIALGAIALAWLGPFGAGAWADPWVLLAVGPLAFAVLLLPRGGAPGRAVGALGWLSFGLPYLVLPVWSLYELHRLSPRLLLVLLVAVWGNDSFAFWVGSAWGRRKLAPRLSPKKTWEGAYAGLAGGVILALAGVFWIEGRLRWQLLAALAVAVVAAQIGDLVESMLKRAASVKDSGRLVPGHGGLLDRLDAIILAAPVFYGLFGLLGLAAGG